MDLGPGRAGRSRHLPDRRKRPGRSGSGRFAAHSRGGRRGPHRRKRAARSPARPTRAPGRLLSPPDLHQGPRSGFFADSRLPRNRRRSPAPGAGSLRPPSLAHGNLGRLGLPGESASRGGFRLQFRQSHVRRRRTHRRQCGASVRRAQTTDRPDRRQSARRGLPGRRADRSRRAQRHRDPRPPLRPARRRSATQEHLFKS